MIWGGDQEIFENGVVPRKRGENLMETQTKNHAPTRGLVGVATATSGEVRGRGWEAVLFRLPPEPHRGTQPSLFLAVR